MSRPHPQGVLHDRLRDLPLGHITTIAGAPVREGVPAREAKCGWPMGVVQQIDGDIIVNDHNCHRIWRIDADGILHTLTGDGVPGNTGDGGPAKDARVNGPHDLCRDRHGNLYFTDLWNNTARRIDYRTGVITTVAGSGKIGRGGDGGPAVEAEFDTTCGVAVDDAGNIFLASEWANTIRRVDVRTGIIDTFAGLNAGHHTESLDYSPPLSDSGLSLGGYSGDGGPKEDAAFLGPEHLAFDSKGNLYVCDNQNHRIRKIDAQTGVVTTVLGTGRIASNGDGGPAVEASTNWPDALCIDANDNIYVGEKFGYRVRKIDAETGIVTTLVGNGVPGFGEEGLPGAETHSNACESGIWADPDGTVLWSDTSCRLRKYDGETGIVTTVLGGTNVHDGEPAAEGFLSCPRNVDVGPDGTIYLVDEWHQRVRSIDPQTGLIHTFAGTGAKAVGGSNAPATEAWLGNPYDVSVDSKGRVVIAEKQHQFIRRVDADGIIRTIAGSSYSYDRGDGGPAMGACFIRTLSVAHDSDDNLYVGDRIGRIRRIDARTWQISTVAGIGIAGYSGDGGPATSARISSPVAIHFDADGNMYFADNASHAIRRVNTNGVITTLVGTGEHGFSPDGACATDAKLDSPFGVAVSAGGTVYFSDTNNHRVRRITPTGAIETVAGSERPGSCGDGGPATEAGLNTPYGLRLYGEDILLIVEHVGHHLRALKIK